MFAPGLAFWLGFSHDEKMTDWPLFAVILSGFKLNVSGDHWGGGRHDMGNGRMVGRLIRAVGDFLNRWMERCARSCCMPGVNNHASDSLCGGHLCGRCIRRQSLCLQGRRVGFQVARQAIEKTMEQVESSFVAERAVGKRFARG